MKLLIEDIPDEGLELDLKEKVELEDTPLFSPVTAHIELLRRDREIMVTGSLGAEVELQCSRCLKSFRRTLKIQVNVVYHPVEEIGSARHELRDDEMDMGFYRGEELDISELLREQILLNLQMKYLCDESCKGLCPHCGADLNSESCTCAEKTADPRLEVLKNFLEKRKE
jgi:uncharacterized protein